CASHALNSIDTPDDNMPISETDKSPVSLNGNCFGFLIISRLGDFQPFFLLPLQVNHGFDKLFLTVCKGEHFSLLKQCFLTSNYDKTLFIYSGDGSKQPCGPCIYIVKRDVPQYSDRLWLSRLVYSLCLCSKSKLGSF
ncbi:hypothetical protein HID58_003160, partial [Brassica napus]